MNDLEQKELIEKGHKLIDRVEENLNTMFDAIKQKKQKKIEKAIKNAIRLVVLDEHFESMEIDIIGLVDLQKIFQDCGIVLEFGDTFEKNGWQCDWWWQFEVNDRPFILSGGILSSTIELSLNVDKLDDDS